MSAVFDALARTGLSLPDAAQAFARAGVPVFPCVPGEKRPLTRRGFHDATTDQAEVGAWWGRWPTANIAIPTGAASGVEVVDVDVHPAGSGFTALLRARDAGLVNGWAALARTPSGGLHIYFPADESREQSSWQAPKAHIDFRGTGGYIIAPPSRITRADGYSASYELKSTGPVTPFPVDAGGLRNFLDPRPALPTRRDSVRGTVDAARLGRWVAALGEGERNRGLFWAACRLAEHDTPASDALAALGPAAEDAGLGSREIATTIRSAYRAARRGPHPPSATKLEPFHPVSQVAGRVIA